MNQVRIIIADDHAIIREGLKKFFTTDPDFTVCGEACDGQDLVDKVREAEYDVVLLDISMPGRSGIDILKQLKAEKPSLPVIILSVYPEDQYAIRAIKAGAAGYITKDALPEDLISAVRRVVQGGKYISPKLAEKLAGIVGRESDDRLHERLSDREYQIFLMLATGKTVSDIARELFLSVQTISTYRSRILEKTGMKNNAEIMHYAVINHLVE